MNELVDVASNADALQEIESAIAGIPLDDRTPWRIKAHVLDKETDEENYVHCLRQINEKLNAVNEAKFKHQLDQVDLEELYDHLKCPPNKFDKARTEIKIKQAEYKIQHSLKYVDDAIHTLNMFYTCFKELKEKVGELTREQYDASLPKTWSKKIEREITLRQFAPASHDYVRIYQNMGGDVGVNPKDGQIGFKRSGMKELPDGEET